MFMSYRQLEECHAGSRTIPVRISLPAGLPMASRSYFVQDARAPIQCLGCLQFRLTADFRQKFLCRWASQGHIRRTERVWPMCQLSSFRTRGNNIEADRRLRFGSPNSLTPPWRSYPERTQTILIRCGLATRFTFFPIETGRYRCLHMTRMERRL